MLQDRLPKSATSEPKLHRKTTVLTRGRVVRAGTRHRESRSSVSTDPDGGNEPKPGSSPGPATVLTGEASTAAKDSGGDTSEPSLAASEVLVQEARPKLQRQKAQSRKTFKFRKTRKEVSKFLSLKKAPYRS